MSQCYPVAFLGIVCTAIASNFDLNDAVVVFCNGSTGAEVGNGLVIFIDGCLRRLLDDDDGEVGGEIDGGEALAAVGNWGGLLVEVPAACSNVAKQAIKSEDKGT